MRSKNDVLQFELKIKQVFIVVFGMVVVMLLGCNSSKEAVNIQGNGLLCVSPYKGIDLNKIVDNNRSKTLYLCDGDYVISSTLKIPSGMSLIGLGGNVRIIADYANWKFESKCNETPENIAIHVQGLANAQNIDLYYEAVNSRFENIKLLGKNNASIVSVGIYAGAATCMISKSLKSTSRHAVYGYRFDKVSISNFDTGFEIGEMWNSSVNNFFIGLCREALRIRGQAVNNTFSNLFITHPSRISTSKRDMDIGINIQGKDYSFGFKGPESNSFSNCKILLYGIGVYVDGGAVIDFVNCTIDLSRQSAVKLGGISHCSFNTCWFMAKSGSKIFELVDLKHYYFWDNIIISNSYFRGNINNDNAIFIGRKRQNIKITGCDFKGFKKNNVRIVEYFEGENYVIQNNTFSLNRPEKGGYCIYNASDKRSEHKSLRNKNNSNYSKDLALSNL